MKPPEDCTGMEDVREAIDTLDREIVHLIGRRAGYVRAAARFKTDEASVRVPRTAEGDARRAPALGRRREPEPGVIEKIYRDLISYFVNRELDDWRYGS